MVTVAASEFSGGVKFRGHRLQGKSSDVLQRLRPHRQKLLHFPSGPHNAAQRSSPFSLPPAPVAAKQRPLLAVNEEPAKRIIPIYPPLPPVAAKRTPFLALIEEAEKRRSPFSPPPPPVAAKRRPYLAMIEEAAKRRSPLSPPPAPVAAKRRTLFSMMAAAAAEEEAVTENRREWRRLVKNLSHDFDKVALGSERGKLGSPVKNSPVIAQRRC